LSGRLRFKARGAERQEQAPAIEREAFIGERPARLCERDANAPVVEVGLQDEGLHLGGHRGDHLGDLSAPHPAHTPTEPPLRLTERAPELKELSLGAHEAIGEAERDLIIGAQAAACASQGALVDVYAERGGGA
jgi:hypothetical protein